MARFQILKTIGANNYYYHLRASGNNEIILRSEGYTTKINCQNAVASVKINAPYDIRYERLYSADRQYYFNLKASNGEPIGTSETYTTAAARENGISLVKAQAPNALVDDLT